MLAIGFLSMVLAATSPASPHGITIRPRVTLDVRHLGPTAQIFNGSLLAAAARSLSIAENPANPIPDSGHIVVSHLDDKFYFSIRSSSNQNVAVVRMSVDGRTAATVSGESGEAVASVPVSYIRAFEAVQQYYNKPNVLPKAVTDRDLADYDAVIFTSGGTYRVHLMHHVYGMQTYLGCFDGSGYSGDFSVDASTLQVSPRQQPC